LMVTDENIASAVKYALRGLGLWTHLADSLKNISSEDTTTAVEHNRSLFYDPVMSVQIMSILPSTTHSLFFK